MKIQKGDFIEFDGLIAVVVGVSGENDIPEDHLALWFGEENQTRVSQGGSGNIIPQVWTVPIELCSKARRPEVKH
jgi:hypothetical protein